MIFYNYDTQPQNYIPNNMYPEKPPIELNIRDNNIEPMFDKDGELKGYEWNYGDTVVIPISTNININVYPNDIICNVSGKEPDKIITRAEEGDRFYNIVDLKSWRCNMIIDKNDYVLLTSEPADFDEFYYYFYKSGNQYIRLSNKVTFELNKYYRQAITYIWVEDEVFTFYNDGITPITLTPNMNGKNIFIEIQNFRHENMMTFTPNGNYDLALNEETSKKLLPGIFYLNAYIISETSRSKLLTYELHIK